MSQLRTLKQQVTAHLSANIPEAVVAGEFPPALFRSPPRQARIAVGFDEIALDAPCQMKLALRFDILCPADGDLDCYGVFEALCGALVMESNPFGVAHITCGEMRYDDALCALVLTGHATICAALTAQADETGHDFKDIRLIMKGL